MKKLLLILAAFSLTATAFAAELTTTKVTTTKETTTTTFDSSKMKCGEYQLSDGLNKTALQKMKCKNYADKKTDVLFIDDNSHKTVDCKVDEHGDISVAKCTTI